jgi:hypothetical protein
MSKIGWGPWFGRVAAAYNASFSSTLAWLPFESLRGVERPAGPRGPWPNIDPPTKLGGALSNGGDIT